MSQSKSDECCVCVLSVVVIGKMRGEKRREQQQQSKVRKKYELMMMREYGRTGCKMAKAENCCNTVVSLSLTLND